MALGLGLEPPVLPVATTEMQTSGVQSQSGCLHPC